MSVLLVTPADGPHAWNQSEPIAKQDKNKNRGEKPKRFFHERVADDVLQKFVKAFDQKLPKILRAFGNSFDVASGVLSETNQRQRHDPGDEHRIGNGEISDVTDFHRLERQSMFSFCRHAMLSRWNIFRRCYGHRFSRARKSSGDKK